MKRESGRMNVDAIKIFFENYNSILEGIVNVFGIIGGIAGFIGFIFGILSKKKAEECEKKILNINTEIDTIHKEITKVTNVVKGNNSQIAQTINNSGIGLKDADYLMNRIVDEKTKNKPNVYYSKEEPNNLKEGDVWLQIQDE